MSSPQSPDATIFYTLNTPLVTPPPGELSVGRVYWYEANPDSPQVEFANGTHVTIDRGNGKGPGTLVISGIQGGDMAYVAIQIGTPGTPDAPGAFMQPIGIVMRRAPGQPGSGTPSDQGLDVFPSVTILGTKLVLADNESKKGAYEFDILFMDPRGNYGLLDPRLDNR